VSEALRPLYASWVQGFLIDAFSNDPVELAAEVKVPVLVVQSMRDLQVSVADTQKLARAAPHATLALVPGVNHVLATVSSDDPSENLATYANPTLPISPGVVHAITQFAEKIMEE
jgi:uncharacterized protein